MADQEPIEECDVTSEEYAALLAALLQTPSEDAAMDEAYLDMLPPPKRLSLPPPPDRSARGVLGKVMGGH